MDKDMNDVLDKLNAVVPGWTEGPGGILCNPKPGGGIIDKTIKTGEWFVIFNDKDEVLDDFADRKGAIEAYVTASEK